MTCPHPIRKARLEMARVTGRWTPQRKADLLLMIDDGTITYSEAVNHYGIGVEEIEGWRRRVKAYGRRGLKQLYQPNRQL